MPKGIVISGSSNTFEIEDLNDNKIVNCIPRGIFKKDNLKVVIGDIVEYEIQNDASAIITHIYERKNFIKRPKMANISQIIFVISMKMPKPDLLLLDKQLAFAELNEIKPVICLNKIDLEDNEIVNNIEKIYTQIGYKVIKTNAKTGEGVQYIKECLKNNITAFSGNSGVGKSTLTNTLFEANLTEEGNISEHNQRGKNTTTSIRLYKIDNNSYIADTPGFSTFDIYEIESRDLAKYFIDLNKYEENCEFIGCTHIKEQKCGVKDAVEQGKIHESRYNSYCKIYEELKEKELHKW